MPTASRKIHIAFGVNEKYFYPMGVTITSIVENNRDEEFVFHIFSTELPPDQINKLEKLKKTYDFDYKTYKVDDGYLNKFKNLDCVGHLNAACFIRLLAPEAIALEHGRLLYLDSDIICDGNISELFDADLSGKPVGAIRDNALTDKVQSAKLGLPEGSYFNSGVLLIDTGKWKDLAITEATIAYVDKNPQLDFADQDALNAILIDQVMYLDSKWNYQINSKDIIRNNQVDIEIPRQAILIHFVSSIKPWHNIALPAAQRKFVHYKKSSPWRDIPQTTPNLPKVIRRACSNNLRSGKYIEAIRLYFLYLKSCLETGRAIK